VGKSSLVNHLLGAEAMKTGAVRRDDLKGHHTTTHRQLFVLPGGALLIDGPGVRELGVWGSAKAVDLAFPDVLASANRCAHRACQHDTEAGCAVQQDVRDGHLSEARLDDYRRLLEEVGRSGEPRRRRGSRRTPS
jgi:ribosome biogenesis GTPase